MLVLTKPLGTGVITTAAKNDRADPAHLDEAIASMMRLNRAASEALVAAGVRAATDITGFGLLGHAAEMAAAAGVCFEIESGAAPALPGALDYIAAGISPGRASPAITTSCLHRRRPAPTMATIIPCPACRRRSDQPGHAWRPG